MKSYLNKALFYKEWKNMMPLSLAFLVEIYLLIIMPFINTVQRLQEEISRGTYSYNDYYLHFFGDFYQSGNGIFVFLMGTLILIGTFAIGIDIMGRKYDSLNAMPFKREEIIFTKWIIAALTVVIPMLLSFVVMSFVYAGNKDILKVYMDGNMILQWTLINCLAYLFIVTFIMLIQSLSGKNILGGVVGSIFLILPMGLSMLISEILRVLALNPNILSQGQYSNMLKSIESMALNSSLGLYNLDLSDKYMLSFQKESVILVVAIVILVILLIYSFKKIPLERNGYVVIFKPLEMIFKIGVSVCFGLLGGVIASSMLTEHYDVYQYQINNMEAYLPIANKVISLTILLTVLCGCIVYVITRKIVEANKR
jgi:ABC-type transport system involved in multi-copper enzyme maturation permease subunit